jgi:hypothetical protein
VFENGFVRYVGTQFVQVEGEHRAVITRDEVENLISSFIRADYFSLQDKYETYRDEHGQYWHITDLPTTYTLLRFAGREKTVKDYAFAPKSLVELELDIDRVANTHRWIDGDKDDLKKWQFVRPDVYRRIKPGMSVFMQAAGTGDLETLARTYNAANINSADETGWTALMLASAMCQEKAVRQLLDWGANVNQRDKNGDAALIGASAAFCWSEAARVAQVKIIRMLLERGAIADARDAAGETPLMAVTTYGNADACKFSSVPTFASCLP